MMKGSVCITTGQDFTPVSLWLDAELGRFLAVDPQGQFHNPYNGMGNNPISMVDPDGESAFTNFLANYTFLKPAFQLVDVINTYNSDGQKAAFNLAGQYIVQASIEAAVAYATLGVGTGISASLGGSSFGAGFASAYSSSGTLASVGVTGAASGFWSGAIIGAGSGFTSGFLSGFANSLVNKNSVGHSLKNGLYSGASGAVLGGSIGGIMGGIDAASDNRKFWSGDLKDADLNTIMKTAHGKKTAASIEYKTRSTGIEHGAAFANDGSPANGSLDVGTVDELGPNISITGIDSNTKVYMHGHPNGYGGYPSGDPGDVASLLSKRALYNNPNLKSYTIGANGGGIYRVHSQTMQFSGGNINFIGNGTLIANNGLGYLYGSSYVRYFGFFGIH